MTPPQESRRQGDIPVDATVEDNAHRWLRLSPRTVQCTVVVLAAVVLVPAVIVAVFIAVVGTAWPWTLIPLGAGAVLFGGITVAEVLRYRTTSYRVTSTHFEFRSGVFSRHHRSLRRDRVRNVDVSATIFVRPFGLCQVIVGSGESSADELKVEPIAKVEGERLRSELLRRELVEDTAGEETPNGGGGKEESVELATIRPAWFRYGVFSPLSATAGYSALAAGLGVAADFVAANVIDAAGAAPFRVVLLAGVVAAAGALVTGAVLALLLHTEAWWGYRLTRESDGTLLVRRGLLNLSSISIEEKRMRGVQVRDYLPLRWFGAASVAAIVSGFKDSGANTGIVPKRTLTPDMPRADALRVAAAALPGVEATTLVAHPRAASRRRMVRATAAVVMFAVLVIGVAWLVPGFPVWLVPALILVSALLAFPYARGSYRGLGHGLSGRFLYLRGGMAARSTAVLKCDAVIGWTFSQTPFQRRSDLTTVGAMVAAGKGTHRAVDADTSAGLALADAAVPGLLAQFLEPVATAEPPEPPERTRDGADGR
ncbi:PH domain-containing protein [Spiractinospora alimapuensis]|uniref:PH domain-containing protein n=1 Tax=Spiractinospora alimapuensis TaxID=2820884 RepID=UPI001F278EEA|nr:PH domain-containing protein [Spiractinospora alimapuensis]QVQ53548.1 PH domain-containing protein [Spiractinospora alimapuensis]